MTKRVHDKADRKAADLCVLDDARKPAAPKTINEYDASTLVGLKVIARHAAVVSSDEEETVELPKLQELMATAAIARCLMPPRLRGREIKAIRKIMRMTLAELADGMDSKTAVETVSRWESEAQLMGGYAEKVLRLLVCERLHEKAPGIAYDGSMISALKQIDPWRADPDYELPAIEIEFVRVRQNGHVEEAWAA
jgi:DNA-binding transcriptional regulator YiaG